MYECDICGAEYASEILQVACQSQDINSQDMAVNVVFGQPGQEYFMPYSNAGIQQQTHDRLYNAVRMSPKRVDGGHWVADTCRVSASEIQGARPAAPAQVIDFRDELQFRVGLWRLSTPAAIRPDLEQIAAALEAIRC